MSRSRNLTKEEVDDIIKSSSKETELMLIPAACFLLILCVVGTVGNSVAIYIFVAKMKRNFQNNILVFLTIVSLLICVLCIPFDLCDIWYAYMYPSLVLCKMARFTNTFLAALLNTALIVLSVVRYRAVCKGKSPNANSTHVIMGIILVSASLAWIGAVVFGLRTVPTFHQNVFGKDCSVGDDVMDTPWPHLLNTVLFLGFSILVLVTIICYFQIWKTVKKSRMAVAAHQNQDLVVEEDTPAQDLSNAPNDKFIILRKSAISENVHEDTLQEYKTPCQENIHRHQQVDKAENSKQKVIQKASSLRELTLPYIDEEFQEKHPAENVLSSPKVVWQSTASLKDDIRTEHVVRFRSMKQESELPLTSSSAELTLYQKSKPDEQRDAEEIRNTVHLPSKIKESNMCHEHKVEKNKKSSKTTKLFSESKKSTFQNKKKLAESAVSLTAFLLTFTFLLSYTPFFLISIPRLYSKDMDYTKNALKLNLVNMGLRLYFLAPAINPIIFFISNLEFRRQLKTLCSISGFCDGT